MSDLFHDASEVSCDANSPGEEIITLDIVRPGGLHVILSALRPFTESHTSGDKVDRLRRISADDVVGSFKAAEVLGISTLAQTLIPYYTDPFTRFAIVSGSNDPALIQSIAVETFVHPFASMSRYAETILTALNPSLFVKLRELHAKRQEIPKTLLPTFMSGQALPDGLNDFAKTCRKRQCPAMKSVKGKSWTQLRNRAASDVWAGLTKTGSLPCQWRELANWALEGSCKGCEVCRKRLSDCFGQSLEAAVDALPKEL